MSEEKGKEKKTRKNYRKARQDEISQFYKTFGIAVRNCRQDQGISQSTMSEDLFTIHYPKRLSNIESARNRPDIYELVQICDYLHVTPDTLLNYKPYVPEKKITRGEACEQLNNILKILPDDDAIALYQIAEKFKQSNK